VPIKQVMPEAWHWLLASNSTGPAPPDWQRGRVGSAAMISSAPAAKMSNMRDAPDVVIATFSRIRLA
jgi:hypothetical protein